MATIKKSNKKKIIAPICILLVIAIVVGSIFIVKAKTSGEEVKLTTIGTTDILESVSATGDVTAGATREYKVGTVATVKEVFVSVGDKVKEGDALATFDTSNLDAQVKKLEASYSSASSAYNTAVKNQKSAQANLASVNEQITALEKELSQAQSTASTTTTKKSTTKASASKTTTTATTQSTTKATTTTTTKASQAVTYPSTLAGAVEALTDLVEVISELTDSVQETNTLTQLVMNTIITEIENGNLSSDAIAKAVGDAVYDAIEKGMVEFVDSGAAVDMIEAAVKGVDWKSVGAGIAADGNVQAATMEIQLAALYAQQEIYTTASDATIVNSEKQIMDASKEALDTLKDAQSDLQGGWTAAFDGTITECNLVAGEQTTLMETGIKLENMDTMVATISLGEYDVHKVKVGMDATITTAYGSYTGKVASIAPTATGGSESSILDSVGSMAGISGLSSLTSSGAGVQCTVTIDDPDENIIIGFDADVEIVTGEYNNVTSVPIESIVLEKDGKYVYLYNEEDNTVTKTPIEIGATSDTSYQVISGVSIGDKIVAIPASDYEDETFEVRVVNQ